MSSPVPMIPVNNPQPAQTAQAAAPNAANALTAGAVAQTHGGTQVTAGTKINSMADLKKQAPEVYQKMLESIARSVCESMREHQDRLKRMMREATKR